MKKYNVAVVGATGNVGREVLNILDFRKFPVNKIFALASSKSEGSKINYGENKEIVVHKLDGFDFQGLNLFTKFYLILFMIIGRIELLTLLIIIKKFIFKS